MKQTIIGVLIVIAVVGGAYLYLRESFEPATAPENSPGENFLESPSQNPTGNSGNGAQNAPAGGVVPSVKEFVVEGKNFLFSSAAITVNKGDTVKITFKNAGGTHDFVIDEFNVRTSRVADGASETIQFVADKVGNFEYYCSVGNHRQMGMKGVLTVE